MEWISVKDRLPEAGKFYLTFSFGKIRIDYLHNAIPANNNRPVWDKEWADFAHNKVSHWMPLPPPPEGGEK